jgi:DNA-binding NarL/FixJ family response regulator
VNVAVKCRDVAIAAGVSTLVRNAGFHVVDSGEEPELVLELDPGDDSRTLLTGHFVGVPRILVTACALSDAEVASWLQAGCIGSVHPDLGIEGLIHAIHEASAGRNVWSRQDLVRGATYRLPIRPRDLTPREAQILDQLRAGRTMREMASNLGISPKTVENTQRTLYRKIGAANRLEAIALTEPARRTY